MKVRRRELGRRRVVGEVRCAWYRMDLLVHVDAAAGLFDACLLGLCQCTDVPVHGVLDCDRSASSMDSLMSMFKLERLRRR